MAKLNRAEGTISFDVRELYLIEDALDVAEQRMIVAMVKEYPYDEDDGLGWKALGESYKGIRTEISALISVLREDIEANEAKRDK